MDDERWLQEFVPNAVRRGILPVSALPCGWTSRLPAEERNAIMQQDERSSTLPIPPLGSMTMDWHMTWTTAWICEGDLTGSDAPPLARIYYINDLPNAYTITTWRDEYDKQKYHLLTNARRDNATFKGKLRAQDIIRQHRKRAAFIAKTAAVSAVLATQWAAIFVETALNIEYRYGKYRLLQPVRHHIHKDQFCFGLALEPPSKEQETEPPRKKAKAEPPNKKQRKRQRKKTNAKTRKAATKRATTRASATATEAALAAASAALHAKQALIGMILQRVVKRMGKKHRRAHQQDHHETQQRKRTRTRQRRALLLMPMDASSASDKKRKVVEGESSPRGLKRMRFG